MNQVQAIKEHLEYRKARDYGNKDGAEDRKAHGRRSTSLFRGRK